MLKKTIKYAGLIWALFFCCQLNAQHTQSGYSIIGVGDINWGGYSHNTGMAGLGISYNSRYFLNNINPALMSSNLEAVFQLGLSLDTRNITGNTGVSNETFGTTAGGFKDFGFVLPVRYGKWNMGFGLSPYTTVNYGFTTFSESGPLGSTINSDVNGRGGIDEVFWTNSVKLGWLQLGVKFSFLFGSIQTEDLFSLEGLSINAFGNSLIDDRRSYSGVNATLGAAYKIPLKKGENKYINLGAFYAPDISLNNTQLTSLLNQAPGGGVFSADTLVNNRVTTTELPGRLGFGLSYEKTQALTVGIDFQTQDWARYRDNGEAEQAYGRAFRIAIGGEITPNYQDLKLTRRINYRFGVHFERTPYRINDQEVNDIGINLGTSIPLSAFWGVSNVNLGVTLGRRGDITDGRIRENYFRINLGFSIQDFTWFARSKFD